MVVFTSANQDLESLVACEGTPVRDLMGTYGITQTGDDLSRLDECDWLFRDENDNLYTLTVKDGKFTGEVKLIRKSTEGRLIQYAPPKTN